MTDEQSQTRLAELKAAIAGAQARNRALEAEVVAARARDRILDADIESLRSKLDAKADAPDAGLEPARVDAVRLARAWTYRKYR